MCTTFISPNQNLHNQSDEAKKRAHNKDKLHMEYNTFNLLPVMVQSKIPMSYLIEYYQIMHLSVPVPRASVSVSVFYIAKLYFGLHTYKTHEDI